MQQFTIEHRAPKKGETYLYDEAGRVQTTVADEDHRVPADVLVPIAPAWPDKHVIVIDEGRIKSAEITTPATAVCDGAGNYVDQFTRRWTQGRDSITAWYEYVPDGYVPQEKVYEAAAQGAAAAAPEPRREYTADDLDQLPEGAIAFDGDGTVWQRDDTYWFMAGGCGTAPNPLRKGIREHFYSAPKAGETR